MATVCVDSDDFEVDANGRLKIKTDCGLQHSVDGIRPNVQAWPFACDLNAANATGIYCDDAASGELRGDPKHAPIADSVSAVVTPSGAMPFTSPTLQLVINNPSNCRTSYVSVIPAQDVQLAVPAGGHAEVYLDIDINSGVFVPYRMWNHDLEDTGGIFDELDRRWTEKTFIAQIAAGASATFKMRTRVVSVAPNTPTLLAMQNSLLVIGGTA